MRYSAATNSVTLKTGLGVVQGHRKWRRSIDHMRRGPPPPERQMRVVYRQNAILDEYLA